MKEIRPSGKYNGYYVEIAERRLIRELLKIEDEAIIEYEKELKEQLKEEGELTEEEPQMEEEITEEDAE